MVKAGRFPASGGRMNSKLIISLAVVAVALALAGCCCGDGKTIPTGLPDSGVLPTEGYRCTMNGDSGASVSAIVQGNNFRYEEHVTSEDGQTFTMKGVMRDGVMYLQTPPELLADAPASVASCVWITLPADEEVGNLKPPTLSEIKNRPGISCTPYFASASDFATPGRVCTMAEIQAAS